MSFDPLNNRASTFHWTSCLDTPYRQRLINYEEGLSNRAPLHHWACVLETHFRPDDGLIASPIVAQCRAMLVEFDPQTPLHSVTTNGLQNVCSLQTDLDAADIQVSSLHEESTLEGDGRITSPRVAACRAVLCEADPQHSVSTIDSHKVCSLQAELDAANLCVSSLRDEKSRLLILLDDERKKSEDSYECIETWAAQFEASKNELKRNRRELTKMQASFDAAVNDAGQKVIQLQETDSIQKELLESLKHQVQDLKKTLERANTDYTKLASRFAGSKAASEEQTRLLTSKLISSEASNAILKQESNDCIARSQMTALYTRRILGISRNWRKPLSKRIRRGFV